ncbi:hypothetical protein [Flavobacterium sp. 3HN19-14]|uniref:hypothetical protein n=1 Tax=Flavobacterium sp. 3HN19-14 TaxID=3448133 RepID=UPI003EE4117A
MNNYDRLYGDKAEGDGGNSFVEHDRSGHVRKLIINMADGSRHFFNYAHLMDGEYNPAENCIRLTFTTGTIYLRGLRLEKLSNSLTFDMVKIITVTEERYVKTLPCDEAVIITFEFVRS